MKKKPTNKKQDDAVLTVEEALELLAPHKSGRKLRVHTFDTCCGILMGCDMDLTQVKREMKAAIAEHENNIRLSGDQMRGIGHGVCYARNNRWLFIETDNYKVDQKLISRGYLEAVIPAITHIKGERKVRLSR